MDVKRKIFSVNTRVLTSDIDARANGCVHIFTEISFIDKASASRRLKIFARRTGSVRSVISDFDLQHVFARSDCATSIFIQEKRPAKLIPATVIDQESRV